VRRAALLAPLLALALPAAASAEGVLVVGDSLEVGTGPFLSRALPGESVTVDARKSRPSNVGVDVLRSRLRPGHSVVVFDLGTNDDPSAPGRLSADLQAAQSLACDRCLVVATLNRPAVDGLNRAVTAFANGSPNVEVVDWHGAAQDDPGLLGPDHIHATPAGYAERARLIAQAVESCLAGGGGAQAQAPEPRSEPRTAAPDDTQPSRIDWAGLPASQRLASYWRAALGVVEGALRTSRAALEGPPPEPVLGGP
jgi:lysophospholipase L1-like esterase